MNKAKHLPLTPNERVEQRKAQLQAQTAKMVQKLKDKAAAAKS